MRIVSFVPAATEVLCALGHRSSLVGVTHECSSVADLEGSDARIVTRARLPTGAPGSVIDGAVRTAAANRNEIVVFDGKALAELQPEVVVLPADGPGGHRCPCLVEPGELRRVAGLLEPAPRPLSYGPQTLGEVLGSVRAIGEAVGRGQEAARLAAELRARIEAVRSMVATARTRPRVALLAWILPPIGAGGILAELVRLAGGRPVVGERDEPARALAWEHLVAVQPEVVVLAPCSFDLARARAETPALREVAALRETPAARWGQVHVVEARRWFSATGPGLVRALEILACLVHPELPWPDSLLPGAAARPVSLD